MAFYLGSDLRERWLVAYFGTGIVIKAMEPTEVVGQELEAMVV